MAQTKQRGSLRYEAQRWTLLFVGLICFGVGIALLVRARIGLPAWEVLNQGIAERTGIKIGTVSILMGLPIMLCWLPLGERPGIGTLINILLVGSATNVTMAFLPEYNNLILQLIQMTGGIIVIGVGTGMYLSAAMGAGPRDGLMLGLARRTGLSMRAARTSIELTVLIIGWLLGGTVGIGTVAFALGVGPVVQLSLRYVRAWHERANVVTQTAHSTG